MPETLEIPEGWEKITPDGGLIKHITQEGKGYKTPTDGSKVTVHYTGRLVSNGEKFDSSRDRDSPFEFKLGTGSVIKGWDKGVATMKKGEIATFRMSSDYGYGAAGSGAKIPGGAALEFDIELLSWSKKEDITAGKKGILKSVIQKGEGYNKPNDCAKVAVIYTLSVDGKEIESNGAEPLRLTVGEDQVPSGFEKCIQSLALKEKASFTVNPDFGFGAEGDAAKGIPPNATLKYVIELVEMEREKETWNMDNSEKLAFALRKKEQGNDFFKKGNYKISGKRYDSALSAIRYVNDFEGEQKTEADNLKIVCELNLASVKMKTQEWKEVISHADTVLKEQPHNVKALYRKGVALGKQDNWDEAKAVLKKGLEVDPENSEIKRELRSLERRVLEQNKKDKNMFRKMFQ